MPPLFDHINQKNASSRTFNESIHLTFDNLILASWRRIRRINFGFACAYIIYTAIIWFAFGKQDWWLIKKKNQMLAVHTYKHRDVNTQTQKIMKKRWHWCIKTLENCQLSSPSFLNVVSMSTCVLYVFVTIPWPLSDQ